MKQRVGIAAIAGFKRLLLVTPDGSNFPDAYASLRDAGFNGQVRAISNAEWRIFIEGKCERFFALPAQGRSPYLRAASFSAFLFKQVFWADAVLWVTPSNRVDYLLARLLPLCKPVFSFYDGKLAPYEPAKAPSKPTLNQVSGRERDLAVQYLMPLLHSNRSVSTGIRLGTDGDGLHMREATGVQWYRRHLLAALCDEELNVDLSVVASVNEARCVWEVPWSDKMRRISPPIASYQPKDRRLAIPIETITGPIDLFHQTFFDPPRFSFGKAVATVYDIMPLAMPEAFPKRFVDRLKMIEPFWKYECAKLICISEATRRDLQEYMGIPMDRTVTIPVACHQHFYPRDPSEINQLKHRLGIHGPYFMALGSLAVHKNLHRLCEAFVQLKKERKIPHQLILVGRPAWEIERVFSAITRESSILKDIVFTGYLDYADVPALYSGAEAFCQPSLYEGYGLPVQEAMCCGVPVLVSNRTSLPEVAGDAGLYCNPEDVNDMADKLRQLAEDSSCRDSYRFKSITHASTYMSWKQVALMHRDIYAQVIERS